jgi:Lon protease-like protein
MFPLGTVLLPSVVLPLHVFEPRYRQLTEDCLAGDQEFGVVLIERGSEVGGGDTRTTVGTVARIVEAARFDDGRWALGAVGTRRLRVVQWLDDDPYPLAEVEDWDDPPAADDLPSAVTQLTATLRRVLALRSELGDAAAPATVDIADEAVLATYQLAAVAPLGPADRQRLLEARDASRRASMLYEMLEDELDLLGRRLALESAGDEPDLP